MSTIAAPPKFRRTPPEVPDPLVVETDIDYAVIEMLRDNLPRLLTKIERERGYASNTLARPVEESFANTLEDQEFLDHRLPAVIVTTAQTVDEPEKDGDGIHYAAYQVVVSSIVRGRAPAETRTLAALFSGCVRRCVVQMPFEGLTARATYRASNLVAVEDPTGAGRWLAAGLNTFFVYVDEVLASEGLSAPFYPDPDPDEPGYIVGEVDTAVIARGVG